MTEEQEQEEKRKHRSALRALKNHYHSFIRVETIAW